MASIASVRAKIQGLIDKINNNIEEQSTDLTTAVDTVIDGLDIVENSIRAKAGLTEKLVFPAGFVEAVEGISGGGGTGGENWIGDGNTHIWISLQEGRTSPMLGVCPNGTVTVDWGDGSTPDVLTGTSVTSVKWTPKHNYASAGDYVITLIVDGEMGFSGSNSTNSGAYILRNSSGGDYVNGAYRNSVQKIEFGSNVTRIGSNAFYACYSLASAVIPESVTSIGSYAFNACYSLASVIIPERVMSIGSDAFSSCYSLASAVIPEGVTSIDSFTFYNCCSLASVVIPESVTSIGNSAFNACYSLASVVIPKSVMSIGGSAFTNCWSVKYFDFTKHTAVPTLSNIVALNGIATDCEIRVPAALYDEWIAATNWSTYASKIVAV
jgi:hypothetical protein